MNAINLQSKADGLLLDGENSAVQVQTAQIEVILNTGSITSS